MLREGPPLENLVRRLAETPADFLAEPRIGSAGVVPVAAVVSDVLNDLGGATLTRDQARCFDSNDAKKDRNRLGIALIGCWLLHDDWFRQQRTFANVALNFLTASAGELAAVTPAAKFITDSDRREELARLCLKDLGLRPANETDAQAQDRLSTLSSVERQRVIRAAKVAEERARAIREEMARKAKAEADARMMRE
ncbi:MAG: hypothetical protein HZB51_10855 [Chloroflexi bacterium]|nr:hypothetical protein [Chloroflexota bacterium]